MPLSRALPLTRRILLTRASYVPTAKRAFHYSTIQKIDSKATYATVVREKPSPSTPNAFPAAARDEKNVATVDPKPLTSGVHEKRDFHWNHPVYTRDEYEAIQVISSSRSFCPC